MPSIAVEQPAQRAGQHAFDQRGCDRRPPPARGSTAAAAIPRRRSRCRRSALPMRVARARSPAHAPGSPPLPSLFAVTTWRPRASHAGCCAATASLAVASTTTSPATSDRQRPHRAHALSAAGRRPVAALRADAPWQCHAGRALLAIGGCAATRQPASQQALIARDERGADGAGAEQREAWCAAPARSLAMPPRVAAERVLMPTACPRTGSACRAPRRAQRRAEVPAQVFERFDADRQAQQAIADAGAARASGAIAACVIVAGCAIRLSTPPSDSASEKHCSPSTKRTHRRASPPSSSNAQHRAEPVLLARAPGRGPDAPAGPGNGPRATPGWSSSMRQRCARFPGARAGAVRACAGRATSGSCRTARR